jgi:hypothetical protein
MEHIAEGQATSYEALVASARVELTLKAGRST